MRLQTVVRLGESDAVCTCCSIRCSAGTLSVLRALDENFGIRWPYDIRYKDQVVGLNQGNRRLSRGNVWLW